MKKLLPVLFVLAACSPKQHVETKRVISSESKRGLYFEDVTQDAGIPSDLSSSSIIAGDYDNDGLVDFVANGRLFKNISKNNDIRFDDVTVKAGLDQLSGSAVFIDINNDGALDIITNKGAVFIQKNKVFVNMTKSYGLNLPEKAYTLSFADVNRDGFADLLVGMAENSENHKFSFLPPKFYLNMQGKYFKEDSARFNFDKYPAYVRGMQWADFDNDQVNEVYFSNYRLKENFMFKNRGNSFVEVGAKYKVKGDYNPGAYYDSYLKKNYGPQYGHTIGSVWADFNNDGNFDLWAANLVHKFVGLNKGSYDYRGYICDDSKIYKNSGAPNYTFTDVRKESGIRMMPIGDFSKYKGDELWSQITASDFDNDGKIDTYISQVYKLNYSYSLLFKNQGNFKFKEVSDREPTRVYDSYGGIWADFNNDGKMDLIVSGRDTPEGDAHLKVFQNIYSAPNANYVKIRLVGLASGRNPVGTQVRVTTDKGVFLRQFEGVTGTLSQQNDPTLHFGLGASTVIKSVQVKWSSGKILNSTGITKNKTWVVTEQK